MKIRSGYDNIPDMLEGIKGCAITLTEYKNDHYIYHIKCHNFFVECAILGMFDRYTKSMKHLEKCLETNLEAKDESKINSINEM